MDRELGKLKRRIERLRNAMVLASFMHGGDLRNQEVLRISVRLDERLNEYFRCKRQRSMKSLTYLHARMNVTATQM
ncbi:aspartyl-phosphate phosphatase Spo0E family protein [Cohnella sp. GCM10027633]|uniref:aspartyl-phosphate phosphatase Spo0E family protein n=1 Tax=unclassified Cohnella TaxID=2636738 RepID=UPI003637E3FB